MEEDLFQKCDEKPLIKNFSLKEFPRSSLCPKIKELLQRRYTKLLLSDHTIHKAVKLLCFVHEHWFASSLNYRQCKEQALLILNRLLNYNSLNKIRRNTLEKDMSSLIKQIKENLQFDNDYIVTCRNFNCQKHISKSVILNLYNNLHDSYPLLFESYIDKNFTNNFDLSSVSLSKKQYTNPEEMCIAEILHCYNQKQMFLTNKEQLSHAGRSTLDGENKVKKAEKPINNDNIIEQTIKSQCAKPKTNWDNDSFFYTHQKEIEERFLEYKKENSFLDNINTSEDKIMRTYFDKVNYILFKRYINRENQDDNEQFIFYTPDLLQTCLALQITLFFAEEFQTTPKFWNFQDFIDNNVEKVSLLSKGKTFFFRINKEQRQVELKYARGNGTITFSEKKINEVVFSPYDGVIPQYKRAPNYTCIARKDLQVNTSSPELIVLRKKIVIIGHVKEFSDLYKNAKLNNTPLGYVLSSVKISSKLESETFCGVKSASTLPDVIIFSKDDNAWRYINEKSIYDYVIIYISNNPSINIKRPLKKRASSIIIINDLRYFSNFDYIRNDLPALKNNGRIWAWDFNTLKMLPETIFSCNDPKRMIGYLKTTDKAQIIDLNQTLSDRLDVAFEALNKVNNTGIETDDVMLFFFEARFLILMTMSTHIDLNYIESKLYKLGERAIEIENSLNIEENHEHVFSSLVLSIMLLVWYHKFNDNPKYEQLKTFIHNKQINDIIWCQKDEEKYFLCDTFDKIKIEKIPQKTNFDYYDKRVIISGSMKGKLIPWHYITGLFKESKWLLYAQEKRRVVKSLEYFNKLFKGSPFSLNERLSHLGLTPKLSQINKTDIGITDIDLDSFVYDVKYEFRNNTNGQVSIKHILYFSDSIMWTTKRHKIIIRDSNTNKLKEVELDTLQEGNKIYSPAFETHFNAFSIIADEIKKQAKVKCPLLFTWYKKLDKHMLINDKKAGDIVNEFLAHGETVSTMSINNWLNGNVKCPSNPKHLQIIASIVNEHEFTTKTNEMYQFAQQLDTNLRNKGREVNSIFTYAFITGKENVRIENVEFNVSDYFLQYIIEGIEEFDEAIKMSQAMTNIPLQKNQIKQYKNMEIKNEVNS